MRHMNILEWISRFRSANSSESVPDTTTVAGTNPNLHPASRTPHSRFPYHSQNHTSRLEASHVVGCKPTPITKQALANSDIDKNSRRKLNEGGVLQGYGRMKSFHVGVGGMNMVTQSTLSNSLVRQSSSISDSGHKNKGGALGAIDEVGITLRSEVSHVVGHKPTPIAKQTFANSSIDKNGRRKLNEGGLMQGYDYMKSFHVGVRGMNVGTQSTLSNSLVRESSSVSDSGRESEGVAFGAIDGVGMSASGESGRDERSNGCEVGGVEDLKERGHEKSDSEEYSTGVTPLSARRLESTALRLTPLRRTPSGKWCAKKGSETLCEGYEREQESDGSMRCFPKFWRKPKNTESRRVETSDDVFEQREPSKVRYRNLGHRRASLKEGFMGVCRVFRGSTRSSFSRS